MSAITAMNQNHEFRRAYHRGKSDVQPALVTYVLKNRMGMNRVGITTGKKLGNAVCRSRARRIIREAYRSLEPQMQQGFDFVFVARGRILSLKSTEVARAMSVSLQKLGVLD